MLEWIKDWFDRGASRPSQPQRRRFSSLHLEPLEERRLLSGSFGADETFAASTPVDYQDEPALLGSSMSSHAIEGELSSCLLGTGNVDSDLDIAKYLDLDGEQPQNDDNSCGPNSAARVLRFHGFHVSYDELKRGFHKADPFLNNVGLGLPAANLAGLMKQFGYQATAARASLTRVLHLLATGKPVLAMIRVGTIKLASPGKQGIVGQLIGSVGSVLDQASAMPALHWIAVQGYDREKGLVYFTDTNGEQRTMAFEDFERAFNWDGTSDLAKTMLEVAGVSPGSIVY